MMKKTVAVIFGGESAEHDVSIMSAIHVASAINKELYDVLYWYISKAGTWYAVDAIRSYSDTAKLGEIVPQLGAGIVKNLQSNISTHVDILFPVLHGPNGEDGSVQGLAQLLHVPIVGCGTLSSALCMNKTLTKQIAASAGVPIVPYIEAQQGDTAEYGDVVAILGSELFVKPTNQGSSVGVSKVRSKEEFSVALKEAFVYGDTVLIERAIIGREIEVAVLQQEADVRVSVAGEIVPEGEFYSYESKYGANSKSQAIIPAALDDGVAAQLKSYAETTFRALHCRGLARIDFFVTQDNEIYLNEVNTMPGFTSISMYPKLWEAEAVTSRDLMDILLKNIAVVR